MIERNKSMSRGKPLLPLDQEMFGPAAAEKALDMLRLHPSYRPSPLRSLREVAATAGCAVGSYQGRERAVRAWKLQVVGRCLRRGLSRARGSWPRPRPSRAPGELLDPDVRAVVRNIDVGCATDGNHGRSVARRSKSRRMRANIFVHEGVSRSASRRLRASAPTSSKLTEITMMRSRKQNVSVMPITGSSCRTRRGRLRAHSPSCDAGLHRDGVRDTG